MSQHVARGCPTSYKIPYSRSDAIRAMAHLRRMEPGVDHSALNVYRCTGCGRGFALFLIATLFNDDVPPRDGDGW